MTSPEEDVKFSSAERLLGAGLALILVALLIPSCVAYEGARRERMVLRDMDRFIAAAERFFLEYGYWPSPHMGQPNDVRYGTTRSNQQVLNPLRAVAGPGNEGHELNPNRIVYLEVRPRRWGRSGLNDAGEWIDPWGMPYQIVLDTDMNNVATIADSIYANQMDAGVVIWSYGRDRKRDTVQDILSWD